MTQYPQITSYLKRFDQAQSKMAEIQSKKKALSSLVNLQHIEQIQTAVEERMGPYMCDTTEQQTRIEKNSYLDVLQEYQKQMEASSASQQQQYAEMKKKLAERQEEIQQMLEQSAKQWQAQRTQLKNRYLTNSQAQSLQQLSLQTESLEKQMQQTLKQLSEQLEIQILQQQLDRRKAMNELIRLAEF